MLVLVVDDDDFSRETVESILQAGGYRVETAINGLDALEKISTNTPDLIISDILMPELDGFEFCHTLKSKKEYSDVPFIFYSGNYVEPEDQKLALGYGADLFVIKPQTPPELLKYIAEALQQSGKEPGVVNATMEEDKLVQLHHRAVSKMLDRKLSELRLNDRCFAALNQLNQMTDEPEEELSSFALEIVQDLTKSTIAYLHFINSDGGSADLWSDSALELCTAAGQSPSALYQSEIWADCVRQEKTVIHNCCEAATGKHGLPPKPVLFRRHMATPIFRDGHVAAVLGVGNKDTDYSDYDQRQLELFSTSMWQLLQRKRSADKLRENESRLREVQRITRLGSWELDLNSNELSWSDENYRTFGVDPNEFEPSYERFLSLVHPDDRKYVDESYTRSLTQDTPYDIDHRIIRKSDDEVRIVHESCEHTRDANGRVIRSIGTTRDWLV